jgi:CheY-like chemotaxis protein
VQRRAGAVPRMRGDAQPRCPDTIGGLPDGASGEPETSRDVGFSRLFAPRGLPASPEMPVSVLIVDDDPVFRRLAGRLVAAGGLVVVAEADTVAAAMEVACAVRPDAALVDIGLPDGDGVALARQLVALPWRPRVVLTSTDPQAASLEDVRRSGAAAFVAKYELPKAALERLLANG